MPSWQHVAQRQQSIPKPGAIVGAENVARNAYSASMSHCLISSHASLNLLVRFNGPQIEQDCQRKILSLVAEMGSARLGDRAKRLSNCDLSPKFPEMPQSLAASTSNFSRVTDLLDPQLEVGVLAALALIVVQRPVDRKRMARLTDRHLLGRADLIIHQALASRPQSFFASTSCSMALSRLKSATIHLFTTKAIHASVNCDFLIERTISRRGNHK